MATFTTEPITSRITKIYLPGNVLAFLAVGAERAALVDTGYGVGSLRGFVETLTDKPLTVILTHGHYDHAGGASEFERAFIHGADVDLALVHASKAARLQALPANGVTASEDELTVDLSRDQLELFESEQEFDLGGLTIRMLPLTGHTHGMHCPLFVEERVVLLGDACNSAAFMQFPEATDISTYRASLIAFRDHYEGLYDEVVYSHPHNFGGKEVVQQMIDLCDQVLTPGFEGVSLEAVLGPGTFIAKPVSEVFAPLDGSCANMVYTQEKVR